MIQYFGIWLKNVNLWVIFKRWIWKWIVVFIDYSENSVEVLTTVIVINALQQLWHGGETDICFLARYLQIIQDAEPLTFVCIYKYSSQISLIDTHHTFLYINSCINTQQPSQPQPPPLPTQTPLNHTYYSISQVILIFF